LGLWTALGAFVLAGVAGLAVAAATTELEPASPAVQPARVPPGTIGAPPGTGGGVEAYSPARLADLGERIARLHLDGEPLGTVED
jgi:hypothetical protein